MQAIKSLFSRRPQQQQVVAVPSGAAQGPTPLTPAELKAVAGGLPRIGGLSQQSLVLPRD